MTRRTKFATAEKVSLALLTRAAFGREAGLRYAKLAGLPTALVVEVFDRVPVHARKEVPGVHIPKDRRQGSRASTE